MIREYVMELKGAKRLPSLVCQQEIKYKAKANTPELIVKMMCDIFGLDKSPEEKVYLICFNATLEVNSVFLIASGGYNQSLIDLKSIYSRILLSGANTAFAVIHNHPSMNVNPSMEDRQMNRRLFKSAKIMGVKYVDFIIVGSAKHYYSFAANEVLSE